MKLLSLYILLSTTSLLSDTVSNSLHEQQLKGNIRSINHSFISNNVKHNERYCFDKWGNEIAYYRYHGDSIVRYDTTTYTLALNGQRIEGRTVSSIKAESKNIIYRYDEKGRLKGKYIYTGTCLPNGLWQYKYDTANNRVLITNIGKGELPPSATTYDRDENKISEERFGGYMDTYSYDKDGALETVTIRCHEGDFVTRYFNIVLDYHKNWIKRTSTTEGYTTLETRIITYY